MKTLKFIGLFLLIFLSITACSDEENNEPNKTQKEETPTITLDENIATNGLAFNTEGGNQSISFTCNGSWSLSIASTSSGATWCTPSATSGGKGRANVSFTVTPNESYDNRSVSVTIKCGSTNKTFTVSQKCVEALLVSTNKYEIDQEGGTFNVEVQANIDYQIEISESAKDWITETESRGLSAHKHSFTIAANKNTEKREGEIYIKSGDKTDTIKVYQVGGPIILLSQNEITVSNESETISVDIQSNVEFGVQMPDVDWIVDEATSRGLSSHTLKYIIKANEGYGKRSAKIIYFDKNSELKDTLNIVQERNPSLTPYLTFTADARQSLTMSKAVYTLEYSLNNGEWTELGTKTIEFGGEKGYLCIRGKNLSGTAKINFTTTDYAKFIFGNDVNVSCEGDIRTLINYENYTTIETNYARFSYLFEGCSCLISAPELPSNNLASYCYEEMFSGCTNLESAPELPATSLAEGCYRFMFENCTKLTTAPKLPATTTADWCYAFMFSECTNLTVAPELPAMDLTNGNYCYKSMFSGCTKLETAPKLPATQLDESCYNAMFYNCESLITAPELPATELAFACYSVMFSGCTNLENAPQLPATNLAEICYAFMFDKCTNLKTAPELPATKLTKSCYASMFEGCTSLTIAPKLPATDLVESCYASMFEGCTSLTIAPKLSAIQLDDWCYNEMFKGCSKLTAAPELPATELAHGCYNCIFMDCTSLTIPPKLPATELVYGCYASMFEGCSSLTTAPELPSIVLAENCYSGMFYGCTSLTSAPKLPAIDLASGCYWTMFYNCTNLTSAPELPATKLTTSCYGYMFSNCINLTTAPKLPATELVENCYQNMFEACSKLNKVTFLATNISATNCLTDWLKNVAKEGIFIKNEDMNILPTGTNGIPSGWTIENYI